jgi:hypothetical protein
MQNNQINLEGTSWNFETFDENKNPHTSGTIKFIDESNCLVSQKELQPISSTYTFDQKYLNLNIKMPEPSPSNPLAYNVFTGVIFDNGKSGAGYYLGQSPGSYKYTMNLITEKVNQDISIGQKYGGGVVAYIFQEGDNGYVAGETHGLIAAEKDQSNFAVFGCDENPKSSLFGTKIGTGKMNTQNIIKYTSSDYITKALEQNEAVVCVICFGPEINGYKDWYLPSRDELTELYKNMDLIGNFNPDGMVAQYWSSSYTDSAAYEQVFTPGGGGESYENGINNANCVRVIRSF